MSLWKALGLAPSEADKRLIKLVSQSYESVRVVGRGTVKIDPHEVSQTSEFRKAREQAKAIVARA
ncbi:hypothetical protein [Alcanivorax quisquiliarum]|uniref:Uncharacterized protein n=1 Tax=Alcanivorax quisquiliarum TaxID=2933565 RepID=A0ABT0EAD6_9GAMM|nr:hypothetical protein [Alcanivorax quisquiliarum]MCK0538794.1 hypothetical protein [Alcanivorax quisquiliarum]